VRRVIEHHPNTWVQRFARALYPYGRVLTVFRVDAKGKKYVVEPGIGATYSL